MAEESKKKRTAKSRATKTSKASQPPPPVASTPLPASTDSISTSAITHEVSQLSYQGLDIQSLLPNNTSIRPDANTPRLSHEARQQDKQTYAEQLNAAASATDRAKVAKALIETGTAQQQTVKAMIEHAISGVDIETAAAKHQGALSLRDMARVKAEELREKVTHAEISRDGVVTLTQELRTQAQKRLELEQARTRKIEQQIANATSAYEVERAKLLGGEV